MSKGLVLVTGANGYTGGHIVDQLLKEGWSVRALSRTGRAQVIKDSFPNAGDRLQTFKVTDILEGDFAEAVKGVYAIIHTASPVPTNSTAEGMIRKNVDGTVNLFKAGIAAGAKKLLYTSSFGALFNADFSRAMTDELLTETDWADITLDKVDIANTPVIVAYMHSKPIAEKEFWKLADEHPDLDFASFLPSMVLGARIPNSPPPSTREALSTVDFIYKLLDTKVYPPIPVGNYVHVQDVAKAHVAALNPSIPHHLPNNRRKRFILTAPKIFTWKEAAEIIRQGRPELDRNGRLVSSDAEGVIPQSRAPADTSLVEEVLGLKEWRGFEETVLETVDYILEWEKANGKERK